MENEFLNPDTKPWTWVKGTRNRIAAYLWFNIETGDSFTLAQIRTAIDAVEQTQTDRRLRELREQDWVIEGYKDSRNIKSNTYILKKKGNKIWAGESKRRDVISNKIRRQVFARDNNTCVVCGVVSGEPYIDSTERARMTVGHRIPNQRLGSATLDNLQTECARCNETIRDELENPEVFKDIREDIDNLDKANTEILYQWIKNKKRIPFSVDVVYSRYKVLSPSEKSIAEEYIKSKLFPIGK